MGEKSICLEHLQAPEFLTKIESLADKLREQFPAAKFDTSSVAQLIAGVQQFIENALGVKSAPPHPFPKLPASLFKDLRPDGPLAIVLSRFQTALVSFHLTKDDICNAAHRSKFLEVLAAAKQELETRGFLRWPKVYVSPACGAERDLLQAYVEKLNGKVESALESPGLTHHVLPFGPKGDPDDGIQYMRNLGKSGDKALVHWWYYPDSYDELVPLESAPELVEPDKVANGPWRVYMRWIKDSLKFNEWMNAIDYEVDEPLPAKDGSESRKRKWEDGSVLPNVTPSVSVAPLKSPDVPSTVTQDAARISGLAGSTRVAPGIHKRAVVDPIRGSHWAMPFSKAVGISLGQGQKEGVTSQPAVKQALDAKQATFRSPSQPNISSGLVAATRRKDAPAWTAQNSQHLPTLQRPFLSRGLVVSADWSDAEILLLLEGLEVHGDNWADISDHVGTKSQFLRLPIEDELLENVEASKSEASKRVDLAKTASTTEVQGSEPVSESTVPFSAQANPVLCQVLLLSVIIGPCVAAAAAKQALHTLMVDRLGSTEQGPNNLPPNQEEAERAATEALKAAARKAQALASEESTQIHHLLVQALTLQMQLLDQRTLQFKLLQEAVEADKMASKTQAKILTDERLKQQPQQQHIFSSGPKSDAGLPGQ